MTTRYVMDMGAMGRVTTETAEDMDAEISRRLGEDVYMISEVGCHEIDSVTECDWADGQGRVMIWADEKSSENDPGENAIADIVRFVEE